MSEAADSQNRIDAIDGELIASGYGRSCTVLSPDGAQLQQAFEARRSALMAERASLAAQLPQHATGAEWGHMVVGVTLGSITIRKCEPEVHITQAEADCDDPYLRFMHECNENWR
jgi:hypothetical protein